MKIFNLFLFLFICLYPFSPSEAFAQSEVFHKYGLIKFDLSNTSLPAIKFFKKPVKDGPYEYHIDSSGLWAGNRHVCKTQNAPQIEKLKILEAVDKNKVWNPICQQGKPFWSGYSKAAKSPYFEIELDGGEGDFYKVFLNGEILYFTLDPKVKYQKDIFKLFHPSGIVFNKELKSDDLIGTSFLFDLQKNGIPHLKFYDNPKLEGSAFLRIDDSGLWENDILVCKIVGLKNENPYEIFKDIDHSYQGKWYQGCKEGKPFYSAYSRYTGRAFFYVNYTKRISENVFSVTDPTGKILYFSTLNVSDYRLVDPFIISPEITSIVLKENPEITSKLDEISKCIKDKDINCFFSKFDFDSKFDHASKDNVINYLNVLSNEYHVLKDELKKKRMKNKIPPEKIKDEDFRRKNPRLSEVHWASLAKIFSAEKVRFEPLWIYSDLNLKTIDVSISRLSIEEYFNADISIRIVDGKSFISLKVTQSAQAVTDPDYDWSYVSY